MIQVIGRKDASGPAPDGTLPQAFGKGSDHASLVQLWADKGFSQRELAALMGAHSVSRAFRQQQNGIPTGGKTSSVPLPKHLGKLGADSLIQVIGRKDASGPAPDGTLPQAFGKGSDHASLVQLWADKGFSQRELAALMGAHSVSRAFRQQQNGIPAGGKAARIIIRGSPMLTI